MHGATNCRPSACTDGAVSLTQACMAAVAPRTENSQYAGMSSDRRRPAYFFEPSYLIMRSQVDEPHERSGIAAGYCRRNFARHIARQSPARAQQRACAGIVLARAGAAAASRRAGIPGATNQETSTPSCWPSIRTPTTTARISSGSARAIRALSMSTGLWSRRPRADAAMRARLYDDLFEHAVAAGHDRVVCEVNMQPPNPASDAFHAALGFVEVGTASVYDGSRTVRYLSCALREPPAV